MKKWQPQRILIFNVNWLGDVLFSTATIRNLRYNFPNSYIACIVPARGYAVLKNNPYLDEIIVFDEKDIHRGLLAKLKFVRQLKAKRFDTAFILHRSFTRALMLYLAGIPQRIGLVSSKGKIFLTKKVPLSKVKPLHRIDHYLSIVENSGLRVEDRYLDFFFEEEDKEFAKEFLEKQGIKKEDFLVAVHPSGNWPQKRWPKEYFSLLCDRLIKELQAKVILLGAHEDLRLAEEISAAMTQKPLIASGRFNLKQLAALLTLVDVFISADSGPLHIANAVGVPKIIALFGPTSVAITGPFPLKNVTLLQKDIGCIIPCYKVNCQDNRCMKAITPEEVFAQVKLIREKDARA